MRASKKYGELMGSGGFLPDSLFIHLDEITYFRNKIYCQTCQDFCYKTGAIWEEVTDLERFGDIRPMIWGRRYVFCPNCHWIFNIRSEARTPNWRGAK